MTQIQEDVRDFLADSETAPTLPVLFSVTDGTLVVQATVNALAIKHALYVNETGRNVAIGRDARVSVSELALRAENYPVRDTNNQVSLKGHLLTWTDISGVQATYEIAWQMPDETTGLIRCHLAEYGAVTPPGRLIIGWIAAPIDIQVVTTPDGSTQTLANGDIIPLQYALNNDGTLTIPYLVDRVVLTPFMLDGSPIQDMPYDRETGTFDNSANGGFLPDINRIAINASIPVWSS